MRKYPFIKQNGLRDCGPACILMILKYYGGYMSIDKLSILLSIDSKGASVYNMVECLKYLGFDSDAYKYNSLSSVKCPCIAHVHYNKYNHYVTIFKINFKKKYIIIGDPNKRIIKTKLSEFRKIWSGIIIQAKPISLIKKEEEPKVLNFIISLIRENFSLYFTTGLLSVISAFLSIITSFFIQISISSSYSSLITSFLITLILKSFLEYLRNNLVIKFNYKIDEKLSKDTFKNIINLPYFLSKNKTSGELISYFNDLFNIKHLLSYISIITFINIPLIILLSTILFIMSKKLFILNIITLFLYLIVYLYHHKKKYYLSDEVLKSKAILNSYITENINYHETINNLNINDIIIDNFKNKYENSIKISKKLEKLKNKEFLYKEFIYSISLLLFLWYISKKSNNFITIYLLLNLLNMSFKEILEFDGNMSNIFFSIKHTLEIPKREIRENINADGDIVINNLNKKFNNKKVLRNINLKIKKGEKIFVTGKSGSGKSTLFKIIKGYYNYEGTCKIDSYECCKYTFPKVLYVSSHEGLFTGRIIDNLSLTKYKEVNKKICEVNNKNDEFIYENGFNLSTGQKQRIALARALNDFNIIIIDEGIEGIDVNMERRIIKNLFKQYKDKTFIYISHRLDNLDLFDRLIKIENGKIILDEKRNK
ncbi:MAG: ATP-binding cassette domain-containing protein [Bacilli bacterium]|nr:ATP-binding cassette domain-containing protein [Bacilli bacterium]